MLIIDPKYSLNSAGRSGIEVAPRPEEKTSGRLLDVGVPDQGVIPRPALGEGGLGLGEERGLPGGTQHREGGPPVGQRPSPELGVRQVDVRRG
jgi:hypothetical protein